MAWEGGGNAAILGGHPPTGYDVVYHSRNRVYAPDMGRFISSDPNETGVSVFDSMAYGGMALSPSSANPNYSSTGLFADGMNTHAACGVNPLHRRDPLGLFFTLPSFFPGESAIEGAMWDSAAMALRTLSGIQGRLSTLLVQHYAKLIVASELTYAAMADPGQSPTSGLLPPGAGLEMANAIKSISGGRTVELLELGSASFRENLRLLTGFEKWQVKGFDAHHIIPQSRAITDLMTKLGIADMIHNPLFGQWMNELDHRALHAAGYNKEWERFLNGLLKENPTPDQAAQKVIDFIKNKLVPEFGIFAPY